MATITGITKHAPAPSQPHHQALPLQHRSETPSLFRQAKPVVQQNLLESHTRRKHTHTAQELSTVSPKSSGGECQECDQRCGGRTPSDSHHRDHLPSPVQCERHSKPVGPILTLSPQTITLLDPADLESVTSLWSIFSKCSDSLENGKRLENISWRLWSRELLYSPTEDEPYPVELLPTYQSQNGTKHNRTSNGSVPELSQVPKLSSSVESSESSSTTTSTQKGSNDKLTIAKTVNAYSLSHSSSVSMLQNTRQEGGQKAFSVLANPHSRPHIETKEKPRVKRKLHCNHLSSEKLKELRQLFNPNCHDEYLKPGMSPKHTLQSKQIKPQSDGVATQDRRSFSTEGSHAHSISTTIHPLQSNSSSIIQTRKHVSLFQTTPHQHPNQPSLFPSQSTRRDSNKSVQHLSKQLPSLLFPASKSQTQKVSSASEKPPLTSTINFLDPTAPTDNNISRSSSKVSTAAPTSTRNFHNKSSNNLPPDSISSLKLQKPTFSLFSSAKEQSKKKASLFPRPNPLPRTMTERNTQALGPSLDRNQLYTSSSHNVTTREVCADYYDSSEDLCDDTDTDSESEFSGIDSNGSRLTYRHRNSTSVSIVRGFSPSAVSVSTRASAANIASSSNSKAAKSHSSNLELSKARPDKVNREKMFFIESSPDESEAGTYSLSSHGAFLTLPRKESNESARTISTTTARGGSLFGNNPGEKCSPKAVFHDNTEAHAEALKAVTEDDDTEADDDDDSNDDNYEDDSDDSDDDSAWDSVDDESDSASLNEYTFTKGGTKPRPLVRSSLLSSLFLNNPEKLQEEQNCRTKTSWVTLFDPKRNSDRVSLAKKKETLAHPSAEIHMTAKSSSLISQNWPTTNFDLHSPRTTRRNMLASELSESVRRNLLWDRKKVGIMKPSSSTNTANVAGSESTAKLIRRHTSVDVAGLNRIHTMPAIPVETWKQDLEQDSNGDFNYHARGW